jgi:hypothetical protein
METVMPPLVTSVPDHRPYRIADVTVVDPRDGTLTPHQDVHIADGRITSVRATAPAGPDDAMVDGSSRFLVPGFVDMHAHPLGLAEPDDALALMLAFGITGYRQMAGSPDLLARRRAGAFASSRAPQLLALSGSLLTPFNAGTEQAAVAEVAAQVRDGADFIKAALITPEVYFPAQAEASRLGAPVLGHLPAGIDVRAASRAGFRSIEHVGPGLGVIAGCSHDEHQVLSDMPPGRKLRVPPFRVPFMEKLVGRVIAKMVVNPAQSAGPADLANMRHALDTFDEDKARELAREFVRNDTWNCPTLIRVKAQELCASPEFRADPDLRLVSAKVRRTWTRAAEAFEAKFSAEQQDVFRAQFAMQLRLVGLFAQEGVPLLAGTDAVGAAWVVAGSSLHAEFDLLAEAGLSPLAVLRTTTCDPARFLGREDVAGTVEAGKEADLVLLDADPTSAVANLHAIAGVVRNGTHYPASALAAMKDDIAGRGVG